MCWFYMGIVQIALNPPPSIKRANVKKKCSKPSSTPYNPGQTWKKGAPNHHGKNPIPPQIYPYLPIFAFTNTCQICQNLPRESQLCKYIYYTPQFSQICQLPRLAWICKALPRSARTLTTPHCNDLHYHRKNIAQMDCIKWIIEHQEVIREGFK